MKRIVLNIILLLMAGLILSSCHAVKKSERKNVKILSVDSVFQAMQASQFQYEWFQGKFSADYKSGDKKQSFSGQFRIRKDSVIWMSIYAVMNIEVFRVLITQDSVFLLNRLKKTYYHKEIGFLNEQLGTDVDFGILQSLLIGSDFNYYEPDKFSLNTNDDEYKLSTVGRRKLKKYINNRDDLDMVLVQSMWINKSDYKIKKQSVRLVRNPNKKVVVQYTDFKEVNQQVFPFQMQFKLIGEQTINLSVKYKSVVIDKVQSFPFKVSKKYNK